MLLIFGNKVSLFSIIIILGFIIAIVIGFKFGFLQKFLKIANGLCGFVFALLFCNTFSNKCLYPTMGQGLKGKLYTNVLANIENQAGSTDPNEIMQSLGIPSFLSDSLADKMVSSNGENAVEIVASTLSDFMAKLICVVAGFFILLIGTTLIFFLLKMLVKLLRTSKFVRILDGTLGVLFYALLFYLLICVVDFLIMLFSQASFFQNPMNFIRTDMQLGVDTFRLSKWFYEHNFIGNFFKMFFNI